MDPLDYDIDLSDVNYENLGNSGFLSLPGWYPCRLVDAEPDSKSEGTLVLKFEVKEGTWAGYQIWERILNPLSAQSVESMQKLRERLGLFAKKLGIWDGKSPNPRLRWINALKREAWLQVEENEYQGKKRLRVAWHGIYAIDDPRAIEAAAKTAANGGKPTRVATKASAAANAAAQGQPYVAPPPPRDPPHRPAPQQDPYAGL